MKITIVGNTLSALVTAGALAQSGNHVLLVVEHQREENDFKKGHLAQEEPGLVSLFMAGIESRRLELTTDLQLGLAHSHYVMLCMVSKQLDWLNQTVLNIGKWATLDTVIINQTTVAVGSAERFQSDLNHAFLSRNQHSRVNVVAMPEFMSEGTAVANFLKPDRLIVGCEDADVLMLVKSIMHPFNYTKDNMVVMSTRAAEYTKYAVNALLATRMSLVNELANHAEDFNVDIEEVRQGLGSDHRIGFSYLYPGCGFGGPKFAEDVKNLVSEIETNNAEPSLLKAVLSNNESQKEVLFRKAWRYFNQNLKGTTIAVWGLSFKPNTATIEGAPSIKTIEALVAQGANVVAYDPKANANFKRYWGDKKQLTLVDDMYDALDNADALMIFTEWKCFWNPDFSRLKQQMKTPVVFDGRNIYNPANMKREGFTYMGIGR